MTEILVYISGELDIPSLSCWTCWDNFSNRFLDFSDSRSIAETQSHREEDIFFCIARVGQPLHPLLAPLQLSSLLLPVSWRTMMVYSVQTSASQVMCIGLLQDLWVTVCCPGHNKPSPRWLIPSGTGYLTPWWSSCLGDI